VNGKSWPHPVIAGKHGNEYRDGFFLRLLRRNVIAMKLILVAQGGAWKILSEEVR